MKSIKRALTAGLFAAATLALGAGSLFAQSTNPTPTATTQPAPATVPTTATKAATDQSTAQGKTTKHKMARSMSRHSVEAVQTSLDRGGANIPVDGIWGPKTSAALKSFQKDHGLPATGHLDNKTREALPKSA